MDPETFLEVANHVSKLKMYPYFEISHCVVTLLYLREDLASGTHLFSRKHPLSCYISSMFSIYAGYMFSAFLLGEPVIAAFKNNQSLILATVVWYLIFYSPFDLVYKFCKMLPIKLPLSLAKEIIRAKKVHEGVHHAAKLYPNGYFIMVVIGVIKGNGSSFLKVFERLLRGYWTPNTIEIMQLSFATKICIIASVVFVVDKKTEFISAPHSLVYLGVVCFFLYFKLSSMLLGLQDPFLPFENLICAIFFGGIWDALSRVLNKGGDTQIGSSKDAKEMAAKKKE